MMQGKKEAKIFQFPSGVNNIDNELDAPEGTARKALNVDLGRSGDPHLRVGYTKLLDLTNAHSLFSNGNITLFVTDSILTRLWPDSMNTAVVAPVNGLISYADVQGIIYYADDIDLMRVLPDGTHKKAWVSNPPGAPTVSAVTAGALPPGDYQITITNISDTGEESGADIGIPITVDGGGIRLTDIPQSDDAASIRIYMTVANGDVFYAQGDIPIGITNATIAAHRLGRKLETQFAEPMPAGHILCHHYGCLYSAVDNKLFYSKPLRQGLTKLIDNYFPPFPERIKIVLAHTTGLFVVSDKTYFLPGGNPEQMTIREVSPLSGVEGTGAEVSASILGLEMPGTVPTWFSDNGTVVGGADGVVIPLMEGKVSVGKYGSGAALYREENGIRSLVTALQNKDDVSGFSASDSLSTEVRRGGITIP